MQYTTNYNLLLPEGTDIVNPLTDVNPNFSTLDTTIKGVSDKTVSNATEVTVGTAHGLTRADQDCNVFAFTATSNWTTGDTITVDGNAVTALKSDGTTLKTGDYVIGSSVLCILQGIRLTVLVSSAAPSAASDITYNNTSSGLTANEVQSAIDEVVTKLTYNAGDAYQFYVNESFNQGYYSAGLTLMRVAVLLDKPVASGVSVIPNITRMEVAGNGFDMGVPFGTITATAHAGSNLVFLEIPITDPTGLVNYNNYLIIFQGSLSFI